jgi:hypothetical protein
LIGSKPVPEGKYSDILPEKINEFWKRGKTYGGQSRMQRPGEETSKCQIIQTGINSYRRVAKRDIGVESRHVRES